MKLNGLIFSALLGICVAKPINGTIEVNGNKFFNSQTGERFFIKGIGYHKTTGSSGETVGYIDSLVDPKTCRRDAARLEELGINTIRVRHIDPDRDHDECMKLLRDAGVYVLTELSEPNHTIESEQPTWDLDLLKRYTSVVDTMSQYDNTMGFIVGDKLISGTETTPVAPFVKAAIRDLKQYMRTNGLRSIPLGYATNDNHEIRKNVADYFVCSPEAATVDFLAFTSYSWCGYSSYSMSGYGHRTQQLRNFPVPVFFGEFGCTDFAPRPFTEIESLYGREMTPVWSGGVVNEYFEHGNSYGVVRENDDGSITLLPDYETLKHRLHQASPRNNEFSQTVKVSCPEQQDTWKASTELPPTPNADTCECLQASLSCIASPYRSFDEKGLLAEICAKVDCEKIEADGEKGVYGQFSECGLTQKTSWALNEYFKMYGTCDFGGRAAPIANNQDFNPAKVYTSSGKTCEEAINPPQTHKSNHTDIKKFARATNYSTQKTKKSGVEPAQLPYMAVAAVAIIYAALW